MVGTVVAAFRGRPRMDARPSVKQESGGTAPAKQRHTAELPESRNAIQNRLPGESRKAVPGPQLQP